MKKLIISLMLFTGASSFASDHNFVMAKYLTAFDTDVVDGNPNVNDKGCSVFAQDQIGMGKLYLSINGLNKDSSLQQIYEGQTTEFKGKEYVSNISFSETIRNKTFIAESYSVKTEEKFCARVIFGGDPCTSDVGVIKTVSKVETDEIDGLIGFKVVKSELKNGSFKEINSFSCY
ncbi:MAG: hypothetical protein CME64_17505 [Halobacteriovoraceae bacterium]|nr:hypothetical protein [Halobacteriovoraceae bacterium]|tara:strand:+ start:846 stop:1370 length:525 start_codon:yes stop_codon:yes gene_type:complete